MAGFLKPLKGFVRKEITDQFLCEILQPWRFLAKHFLTTKTAAKRTERVFQVFFIWVGNCRAHYRHIYVYSYFKKGCRKNVHATIPKSNMGYDQYTVPNHCSCRTYYCCFPLAHANKCPWPPVPFFQISLKNSTFRDWRLYFFLK